MKISRDPVDLAAALTRLRVADARLARRRASDSGLSDTDRAAMRFVLECAERGTSATPSAIAAQLALSPAAVTALVDRLASGGFVTLVPHPDDRRSKHVVPSDRTADPDVIDPVTARIRSLAGELGERDARVVAAFLDRVCEAVTPTAPAARA